VQDEAVAREAARQLLQRAVAGLPAAAAEAASGVGSASPSTAACWLVPLSYFCSRGAAHSAIAGPADLSPGGQQQVALGPEGGCAGTGWPQQQQAALTTSLPAWFVHGEGGSMPAGVRRLARQLAVPAYGLCMAPGAERCSSLQALAEEYLQVRRGACLGWLGAAAC
jgi:hypothetical protein